MPYEDTDWDTADGTARDTAQHFFFDTEGAHVTTVPGEADTGLNSLWASSDMHFRDGTVDVARFGASGSQVGADGASHISITSDSIGMYTLYFDATALHVVLKHILSMWYDWSNDYAKIIAPDNRLWLQAGTGNITVASADGDASAAVRLRGGRMQVIDQDGNQLWTGTAQELADALNGGSSNASVRVYGGSIVKTVTATREPVIFSNAEVRSMFHVASGDENKIGLTITNGDYGAQAHRITSISYRSSSGWSVYLDSNASAGAFRLNYVAVVPAEYSTV